MSTSRQVIAVAGAGDLGRYVCEEILASPDFDLVIISRQTSQKWFSNLSIPLFESDYSMDSILSILNRTCATILLSFIDLTDVRHLTLHAALLAACTASKHCKRLLPSEYIGDVESYPLKPDYYATTRLPFREMLKQQEEVEWTLFNPGWLMDYFLPSSRTYLKPIKGMFPVDVADWSACVKGTGDEVQSWTCARDVGKALVELCRARIWVSGVLLVLFRHHAIGTQVDDIPRLKEQVTYVAGEWSTFNAAITTLEIFYGRPMPKTYKSWSEIQSTLAAHADGKDMTLLEIAQIEEMMVMGCLTCPKDKTLRQREKFFTETKFLDLEALLRSAEEKDGIVCWPQKRD